MQNLFFELIRVSIGTQESLSRTPSAEEWALMYKMAKNQTIDGVCFAGVQRLAAQQQGTQNLPELLYARWMFAATKIQRRNETLNHQCAELSTRLLTDGFDSVVMKGQSIAKRYGSLATLRQPGDIDIWLAGEKKRIKDYVSRNFKILKTTYNHAEIVVFKDTEVEAHFTPSWLYSPFRNKKLQAWFESFQEVSDGFKFQEESNFKSPSLEFDLVYLMLHNYRHLMHEGLWFRQMMDYYFVLLRQQTSELCSRAPKEATDNRQQTSELSSRGACGTIGNRPPSSARVELAEQQTAGSVQARFNDFGLTQFAGAVMYVLQEVFGLEEASLICKPDAKRGRKLLAEIVRGENMKHEYDPTIAQNAPFRFFWDHMTRQLTFMFDYPSEVLWAPLWKSWHFVMRKLNRI